MTKYVYYRLHEINKKYNVAKLHKIIQAAVENRLMSKYSKLIANNKEMFVYWYEQAHKKRGKDMVLMALLALKADLSAEQSILTINNILAYNVNVENKRNVELFYSSSYHYKITLQRRYNNSKGRPSKKYNYYKWYQYLLHEHALDYSDISDIYAEIIDTEIITYRGKISVANFFAKRIAQLGNDILYKNNFWSNANVLSYRLQNLYGLKYKYLSSDDVINYVINYPWKMRHSVRRRKYTVDVVKEWTKSSFPIRLLQKADNEQLVYVQPLIANLLLKNIAIFGLTIPISLVFYILNIDYKSYNLNYVILILGFNLSIKFAYALDMIQALTLICTGVLVDSITTAELTSNLNLTWYANIKLSQTDHHRPINLHMFDHKLAPLINDYKISLPLYARIAKKVLLYMDGRISASTLMSSFGINNYCLIKHKSIVGWEQAHLNDIMAALSLIWSNTPDELQFTKTDIYLLLNGNRNLYQNLYNRLDINLENVADLLQLDNNALAEKKNIANIYNRADMIRIAYGKENYFRHNFYVRGDGQIYNLETDTDLHFTTPTEMAQAMDLSVIEKVDVAILSIIDAFDLLNNPDLWRTFKHDLNLDWTISKIANI